MTTTAPSRVNVPVTGADRVVVESDLITPGSVPEHVLAIYVMHDGIQADHPVQGRYVLRAPVVEFTPLYPFGTGQAYQIEIAGRPRRTFTLARRAPQTQPRVMDIFPTAPRIPRNTLRLHVGFSAPMQRQRAREFLRLFDDDGRDITAIIVDLGQELWSPDSTRLTVLLDPGRAKRGIHATREPGPVLTEDRTYNLVVGAGWPAATGAPLTAGRSRTFEIGPAQRAPLDDHAWILSAPAASSRDPVLLDFGRTMDMATLSNRISVVDTDGHAIAGTVAICHGEQRWSFKPTQRWAALTHELVVDADLEDIAGNRVGEALDHDVHQRRTQPEPVSLPFHP